VKSFVILEHIHSRSMCTSALGPWCQNILRQLGSYSAVVKRSSILHSMKHSQQNNKELALHRRQMRMIRWKLIATGS